MEDFTGRESVGQEGISNRKEKIISGQVIFIWGKGMAGIFIMQITSLVVIRKFQIDSVLNFTFLRGVGTAIKS